MFANCNSRSCCVPFTKLMTVLVLVPTGILLAANPPATTPASKPTPASRPATLPAWAEELRVLPEVLYSGSLLSEKKVDIEPGTMMHGWLMRMAKPALTRYDTEFDRVLNENQILGYRDQKRKQFLELMGEFPQRSPLNPQITGKIEKDGYRIEKLIFESEPGRYVTALLFLPTSKPPYPGVLVPCGHAREGKAHDTYQRVSILLAKSGMAALCYDPLDQGERHQVIKPRVGGSGGYGHTFTTINSMLVGRSSARWWVWDAMRGIDYLQSRPDIDPEKIGCTGNSGGGTCTAYVMAVDDRIKCAGPSCFIASMRTLVERNVIADGEQCIHGAISEGLSHPEFIIMRGPKPTIISAAYHDGYFSIAGTWDTFHRAKQAYALLGFSERVDMVEARDAHGFTKTLRVGVVRWMRRWLMNIDDASVDEKVEEPILTDEQAQCTPSGEVMRLRNARNIYDENADYEKQLAEGRRKFWKETEPAKALEEVRRITGIRKLTELRAPRVAHVGSVARDDYHIDRLILHQENEVWLPTLAYVPDKPNADAYLYLHQDGKFADAAPGGPIEKLVHENHIVLSVDLGGIGETQADEGKPYASWANLFGHGFYDMSVADMLGTSFLACRTESVMICARYLPSLAKSKAGALRVHVISVGRVGPPVLHAAALEPQLFETITLKNCLASWVDVVNTPLAPNQMANAVFGVLKVYDLPDLVATLPKEKVSVVEPFDAMEKAYDAHSAQTR